MYNAATINC